MNRIYDNLAFFIAKIAGMLEVAERPSTPQGVVTAKPATFIYGSACADEGA